MIQKYMNVTFLLLVICVTSSCKSSLPEAAISSYDPKVILLFVDWSPDSQRIVGSSQPRTNGTFDFATMDSSELFIWDWRTNEFTQITSNEFSENNSKPSWSPNGSNILFYSKDEFGDDYDIGVINIENSEKRGLTEFGRFADWFPNGTSFAMIGYGTELLLVDIISGEIQHLWEIPQTQEVLDLAVAPNGQSIALLVRTNNEPLNAKTELWIINIDSGAAEKHFEDNTSIQSVTWLPDSNAVTIIKRKQAFTFYLDKDCITQPLSVDLPFRYFQWAPDGRFFVALFHDRTEIMIFESDNHIVEEWLASVQCN